MHEHEERQRQQKEAVDKARMEALQQRQRYILDVKKTSTDFIAVATEYDKGMLIFETFPTSTDHDQLLMSFFTFFPFLRTENLLAAINNLQITIASREKAIEDEDRPEQREKTAALQEEIAQMQTEELQLLQELDKEAARFVQMKRIYNSFDLDSLLQRNTPKGQGRRKVALPVIPGVLHDEYEMDWKSYRSSIRSAQQTLLGLSKMTAERLASSQKGASEDENDTDRKLVEVSRGLEDLCVSMIHFHRNEALAVSVSPDDAYNMLLHELDKLCRLYVVLFAEREKLDQVNQSDERDTTFNAVNSLIKGFKFNDEVSAEVKAAIFDPYAVAGEHNTVSEYHMQMRVELNNLLTQLQYGDAAVENGSQQQITDPRREPATSIYHEFNNSGSAAQFGMVNGETAHHVWAFNQIDTVQFEIAALFSCIAENDDYWQSAQMLLKEMYDMSEQVLKPVGDRDDEDDSCDAVNEAPAVVESDNERPGTAKKRKRAIDDEGEREDVEQDAASQSRGHPADSSNEEAQDENEEASPKVSYLCSRKRLEDDEVSSEDMEELADLVDRVLITGEFDVLADRDDGKIALDPSLSKKYGILMHRLLAAMEHSNRNQDAPPKTSSDAGVVCGANLRESTCNMLNDFMVWLDRQLCDARELDCRLLGQENGSIDCGAEGGIDGNDSGANYADSSFYM